MFYCLLLLLFFPQFRTQGMGPAEVLFEKMEKCTTDKMNFKMDLGVKKVNQTHFKTDFLIDTPFDIDFKVPASLNISKYEDNSWRQLHQFYEIYGCLLFLRFGRPMLFELMEKAGKPKDCPIKKGRYTASSIYGVKQDSPMPYGFYKLEFAFLKDNVFIGCIRSLVRIIPFKK